VLFTAQFQVHERMMVTSGQAGKLPYKAPKAQESIDLQRRVKLLLNANGLESGLIPVEVASVGWHGFSDS